MLNNAKAKGFWFKAFSSLGEKDSEEEEGEDESRFILPVVVLVVTKQ